jgi:hypothetical protein
MQLAHDGPVVHPLMNSSKDGPADNQLKWWRSPGVIYFLAAGTPATAIKIGVTSRATLLDRMKKTQVHNQEPIELLGVIRFSDGEFPTRDAEDQARMLHGELPTPLAECKRCSRPGSPVRIDHGSRGWPGFL